MTEATAVDIDISGEKSYGEKVAGSVPFAGNAAKALVASEDGDWRGAITDATGFISECQGFAVGMASDPLGWLIGQGLNFLISVVQPLQEMIHFVSGDGPALANAAGNFNNIGQGMADYAGKFAENAQQALAKWEGEAKQAAQAKLDDFATGITGITGQAGDIAQLLQISSMVMTVIEEFIKAVLTEFVEWLIMIWIPALAAAAPTFGASISAAWTGTYGKATHSIAKGQRQVSKLQRILNKLKELLAKLKDLMSKTKNFFKQAGGATQTFARAGREGAAMRNSLYRMENGGSGVLSNALGKGADSLKEQVGIRGDGNGGSLFDPGKVTRNVNEGVKVGEYDGGDTPSVDESRERLDI